MTDETNKRNRKIPKGCVAVGTHVCQVEFPTPRFMRDLGSLGCLTFRETTCIDRCLAGEVRRLWALGIVTTGCCCGHGTKVPYIGVRREDERAMASMGYSREPGGKWCFIPKTNMKEERKRMKTKTGLKKKATCGKPKTIRLVSLEVSQDSFGFKVLLGLKGMEGFPKPDPLWERTVEFGVLQDYPALQAELFEKTGRLLYHPGIEDYIPQFRNDAWRDAINKFLATGKAPKTLTKTAREVEKENNFDVLYSYSASRGRNPKSDGKTSPKVPKGKTLRT